MVTTLTAEHAQENSGFVLCILSWQADARQPSKINVQSCVKKA